MSGFILTSTIYLVNFASDKYVDIYNGNGCTKHLAIRFPISLFRRNRPTPGSRISFIVFMLQEHAKK